MPTIYTLGARCRLCYSCVRICPANAIKIEKSCVITLEDRCILCGYCIKVCSPEGANIPQRNEASARFH